jgi:hypothetical protein
VIPLANKDDYNLAAAAVNSGTATRQQRDLNERMAKQAGTSGNRAREAREGKMR